MSLYLEQTRPLANIIKAYQSDLSFHMMEVGALPIGDAERFHCLLELFPGSTISAIELDSQQCAVWNEAAQVGLRYYPVALSGSNGKRQLYETKAPMCTSLYPPDEAFISLFNRLDVVRLKRESQVETVSLDQFAQDAQLAPIDFMKIDVQGAEAEIFSGGAQFMSQACFVVSEVEFVELYKGQPLFADVSRELSKYGLMFHKFLGLSGRPFAPVVVREDERHPSQHMWADAVYINDVRKVSDKSPLQWLKCGVFAYLYGSADLSYFCFREFDKENDTDLHRLFLDRVPSLRHIDQAE